VGADDGDGHDVAEIVAPSLSPSLPSRTPRLNLGGTVMAATVGSSLLPVVPWNLATLGG
jgi:hypothetical protein